MKLHKRIRAALLAARIEYHWWFVLFYRRRGEKWIDGGEPLNSKRMLRLNGRANFHGLRARKYEKRYEIFELCAVSDRSCSGQVA